MFRVIYYTYCEFTYVENGSGLPAIGSKFPTGKVSKRTTNHLENWEDCSELLDLLVDCPEVTGGTIESYHFNGWVLCEENPELFVDSF